MIPKIIHHIWFDFGQGQSLPERYIKLRQMWLNLHPNWSFWLWDEIMADKFVKNNYPEFSEVYFNYRHKIQKVDSLRYMIMHFYGGIYSDVDIECLESLEVLTETYQGTFVGLPKSRKFLGFDTGISNSLLMSSSNHSFWKTVLHQMKISNVKKWYQPTNLYILNSTGPTMLYKALKKYQNSLETIYLFPEHYFQLGHKINCDRQYTVHLRDGSWINKNKSKQIILYCGFVGLFLVILIITMTSFYSHYFVINS